MPNVNELKSEQNVMLTRARSLACVEAWDVGRRDQEVSTNNISGVNLLQFFTINRFSVYLYQDRLDMN